MTPPWQPLEVRDDLADRLGLRRLLVWRDDRSSSAQVGGAKARNLRHHLGTMRDQGCDRLLITARAGSNLVMAASRMMPALGITVTAVLRPQPDSEEARRNLAVTLDCGTSVIPVPLDLSLRRTAPFMRDLRERMEADGHLVSLIGFGGGEQDAGRAHVEAFGEMAQALLASGQPVPDTIYMAAASFSSGVGVGCALARAGWPTTLVLVNVAQDICPSQYGIGDAIRAFGATCGFSAPPSPVLRIIDRLAPGFGRIATQDLDLAAEAVDALRLDLSYTAKAFAALSEDARSGRTGDALFWHSGTGRPDLPARISLSAIPRELAERLLLPA